MILERLDNNLADYSRSKPQLSITVDIAVKMLEAIIELRKREITVSDLRPESMFYDGGKLIIAQL
jgi:hypothetical protein